MRYGVVVLVVSPFFRAYEHNMFWRAGTLAGEGNAMNPRIKYCAAVSPLPACICNVEENQGAVAATATRSRSEHQNCFRFTGA